MDGALVSHMNTPVRDTPRRRGDGDGNGRPGPTAGSPDGLRPTEDGHVVAAGHSEAEYWEGGLNACTRYRLAAAGLIERLSRRVLTVGFADGYDAASAANMLGPQHRRLVKTRTWRHGRETAAGRNGR